MIAKSVLQLINASSFAEILSWTEQTILHSTFPPECIGCVTGHWPKDLQEKIKCFYPQIPWMENRLFKCYKKVPVIHLCWSEGAKKGGGCHYTAASGDWIQTASVLIM